MTTLIRAEIYWDTQDPQNEGWAWRARYAGGHEESGEWDFLLAADADADAIQRAVVAVAHQHGQQIEVGDVAVDMHDGGHGIWDAA